MRHLLRCTIAALAAVAFSALLSGCGSDGKNSALPRAASDCPNSPSQVAAARQSLIRSSRAVYATHDMIWRQRSIEEMLGNTRFSNDPGEPARALTEAVLVGQAISARPGYGYLYYPPHHKPASAERVSPRMARVSYDDPRAGWRSSLISLRASEVFSGPVRPGQVVEIESNEEPPGLCAYLQLGPTVWFLGPNAIGASNAYSIFGLAFIGKQGQLSLPLLEPLVARDMLHGGVTLAQLRAAARRPTRVIQLRQGMRVDR